MTGEYFKRLMEWQKGKDTRYLKVEMGINGTSVFAYDTSLGEGELLKDGKMPDIEKLVEQRDFEQFERLRAKYA